MKAEELERIKIVQQAIREMKPRTILFNTVKNELTERGHWKNKSRGKFQKERDRQK